MVWFKGIVFCTGVVVFAVALGCEFYKWQRQQNQRAISQGPTSNAQERKKLICGICLKNMNKSEAVFLPCEHTFCSNCLEPLLSGTQTSCCDCRMEITPDDLLILKSKVHKQE